MQALQFSGSAIARALHCTRASLRYALGPFRAETNITDEELDHLVTGFLEENYLSGSQHMLGRLRVRGVIVTRTRVRQAVHRVDPNGGVFRRARLLRRRVYSVPHVNYVWHIDGWHKLIRLVNVNVSFCYHLFNFFKDLCKLGGRSSFMEHWTGTRVYART